MAFTHLSTTTTAAPSSTQHTKKRWRPRAVRGAPRGPPLESLPPLLKTEELAPHHQWLAASATKAYGQRRILLRYSRSSNNSTSRSGCCCWKKNILLGWDDHLNQIHDRGGPASCSCAEPPRTSVCVANMLQLYTNAPCHIISGAAAVQADAAGSTLRSRRP